MMAMKVDHGDDGEADAEAIFGKTKELSVYMNRMPELTQKKRQIDMHTNIATALIREIQSRDIGTVWKIIPSNLFLK